MTLTALSAAALLLAFLQTNQTLVNPTPSDARSNQFEDARGSSWKVFALDSSEDGPLGVVGVEEIRQQNPPSHWAVVVQNRGSRRCRRIAWLPRW